MPSPPYSSPGRTPKGATSLVDRVNLSVHLRRYLKLVVQRWFILAITVPVCLGYFTFRAVTSPNIYQAYSVVKVAPKVQRGFASGPEIREDESKYFESQREIMESSVVQGNVRQKIQETAPGTLRTITNFNAHITEALSFNLTVQATDFSAAKLYARTWAEQFIAYKEEQREKRLGKSAKQISAEVERYEENLRKARQELDDFRIQNKIVSLSEIAAQEKRQEDLKQLHYNVQTELKLLSGSKAEDLASNTTFGNKGSNLQTITADRPPASGTAEVGSSLAKFSNERYKSLKLQLANKQAERDKWRSQLRDRHPYMASLIKDIEDIEREIQGILNIIEDERIAMIRQLEIRERELKKIIDDTYEDVRKAGDLHRTFARLEENEKAIKTTLDGLKSELRTFEMASKDDEQFEILEEVLGSPVPIAPKRKMMILSGLVYGLALGGGLIYFLHRLDDRLELAQDVEAELEEPVLGQIPEVPPSNPQQGRILVTDMDQYSLFAEAIRGIRSAVMFGGQGRAKKVLLATSAVPGDGKTTFTVNFAVTLALAGHRVLLIDADLRRGNVHNYFDFEREPGLAEILEGELHWSDVLQVGTIKTLDLIKCGRHPESPGELLISPIMRELMQEVTQFYDYVVIDCPPLTAIDDTFSLLGFADGLLFVVRAGQTSMRFAKNALAAVRQRGAKVLGVVLNGITADNPYYYYSNYYHSYYKVNRPPGEARGTDGSPRMKMAAPKQREKVVSIEEIAKARAGQTATAEQNAESELSKTEIFRRRRAAQKASNSAPPAHSQQMESDASSPDHVADSTNETKEG